MPVTPAIPPPPPIRSHRPPHALLRPEIALPFLAVALIWGSTWLVIKDQLAAARLLTAQAGDQHDAAAAAARTSDLAFFRYREGASDYLDVVTAQTAALEAERAEIAVRTMRLRTAVALVRALGGGVS